MAPDARRTPCLGDDERHGQAAGSTGSKLAIGAVVIAAPSCSSWLGFAWPAPATTGRRKITDVAIERVFPQQGDLVLRQSQVGVDLAPGYRGVLVIDGQELPTTDLVAIDPATGGQPAPVVDAQFDPAQNTVLFTPRDGRDHRVVRARRPHRDRHVLEARRASQPDARSFTWRFKVS